MVVRLRAESPVILNEDLRSAIASISTSTLCEGGGCVCVCVCVCVRGQV